MVSQQYSNPALSVWWAGALLYFSYIGEATQHLSSRNFCSSIVSVLSVKKT